MSAISYLEDATWWSTFCCFSLFILTAKNQRLEISQIGQFRHTESVNASKKQKQLDALVAVLDTPYREVRGHLKGKPKGVGKGQNEDLLVTIKRFGDPRNYPSYYQDYYL